MRVLVELAKAAVVPVVAGVLVWVERRLQRRSPWLWLLFFKRGGGK